MYNSLILHYITSNMYFMVLVSHTYSYYYLQISTFYSPFFHSHACHLWHCQNWGILVQKLSSFYQNFFFFKIYFSLVSALLPAVVLNYLPQVLILFKLSNKLHQLHISSIWSMAQTITYIHVVKLCSFCFCNNCVYCLSLPYNIKSLIL